MIEALDNFTQLHWGIALIIILKYIFLFLGALSLIVSIKWFLSKDKHEPTIALISAGTFFVLFIMAEIKEKEDTEKEKNKEKIEQQRFEKLENDLHKGLYKKEYKTSLIITDNSVGGIELGMNMSEVLKIYNLNNGFIVKNFAPTSESDSYFGGIGIFEKDTSHLLMYLESSNNWQSITAISVFSKKFSTGNGLHPGMQISEYLDLYPGDERLYWNEDENEEFFKPFNLNTKETRLSLALKTEFVEEEVIIRGIKTRSGHVVTSGVFTGKNSYDGEDDSTYNFNTEGRIFYIKVWQPSNL